MIKPSNMDYYIATNLYIAARGTKWNGHLHCTRIVIEDVLVLVDLY